MRPPGDPAAIERGKALYGVNCQFCHGADTRGGDGGPSLLRSSIVLADDHGELMGPIIRSGRPGLPKFTLTDVTTNTVLDSETDATGGGHAHSNQTATHCSGVVFEGTASEIFGTQLPPGVAATDMIQGSIDGWVITKL